MAQRVPAARERERRKVPLGVYWAFQIPFAWFLSHHLGLGSTGAFWAIPSAEALLTLIGLYFFRKGRWKLRKI